MAPSNAARFDFISPGLFLIPPPPSPADSPYKCSSTPSPNWVSVSVSKQNKCFGLLNLETNVHFKATLDYKKPFDNEAKIFLDEQVKKVLFISALSHDCQTFPNIWPREKSKFAIRIFGQETPRNATLFVFTYFVGKTNSWKGKKIILFWAPQKQGCLLCHAPSSRSPFFLLLCK